MNFKPPSLVTFNEKSEPYQHTDTINTRKAMIEIAYSLKDKLISNIFKEETLSLYMNFPILLVSSYEDLSGKLIH